MVSALCTTPFFCKRYATYRCEAPCGTSTKTPPGAKPWYGFVMPYQIHAAAPPATNTTTSNSARKYFNAASPVHFLTSLRPFRPLAPADPDTLLESPQPPRRPPTSWPARSSVSCRQSVFLRG